MKKSKIILSSFLGVIALIMLTGAIELRFWGEKRSKNRPEEIVQTIELGPKQHLKATEISQLVVSKGQENQLKIYYLIDSLAPSFSPDKGEDTLYIHNIKGKYSRLELIISDSIQSISADNTSLLIKELPKSIFSLDLDRTVVRLEESLQPLQKLNILAKNDSRVTCNQSFDSLEIYLFKSEARFHSKVQYVSGNLQESQLRISGAESIRLDKDDHSRLDIR
ncbi:MAG: hypothetical protein ACNS62_10835 [Candidatus Cyclobacteriaceae bacterium M3_2C_046]